MALTSDAHQIIHSHLDASKMALNLAVDATCGNGYDTQFLCSLGFREVVAFDIQVRAIRATQHRLSNAGYQNFRLVLKSHEHLASVSSQIDCAMFNFGYLPHGDKTLSTQANTSLIALQAAIKMLSSNGILTAICYPGHPLGLAETLAVTSYFDSLRDTYSVQQVQSAKANNRTPLLLVLTAPSSL